MSQDQGIVSAGGHFFRDIHRVFGGAMKERDSDHNLPEEGYLAEASWREAGIQTLKGLVDSFGSLVPGAGFVSAKLSDVLSGMQDARVREAFERVRAAVGHLERRMEMTPEEFADATRRLIIHARTSTLKTSAAHTPIFMSDF
jgi:hypothetical protein